jgi:GNAT superfamily N-acetyltransferase
MGKGLDERELRRRAIEGVRDEVEAFGSGAPDSQLMRRDGLLASLSPSTPQRSLFNSIFCDGVEPLAANIDELGELYDSHGVRAWTVWVPDGDRESAALLAERGHELDAAPRAMAMPLEKLDARPPCPDGVALGTDEPSRAAELNDRAYGYGPDGFRTALSGPTSIAWSFAFADETPVGCVGAIDIGDDCCITGVATPPEHRGRGIAGWLLWQVLEDARQRGMASASLQATKAGAPLYERLGFTDYGFVEMWELRK